MKPGFRGVRCHLVIPGSKFTPAFKRSAAGHQIVEGKRNFWHIIKQPPEQSIKQVKNLVNLYFLKENFDADIGNDLKFQDID